MNFRVREARVQDLADLLALTSQFTLLTLPPREEVLQEKIRISVESFAGRLSRHDGAEFLFVLEDIERNKVVGSSLIIAKHGTPAAPHHYFKVRNIEKYSSDLGIGFVHQVLTLSEDQDGPTEIGGLLVSKDYRGRPEKLGRIISLVRFLFMGMHREYFEDRLLCELSPPLTKEGRSEFWEALGRRYTGLPYQEADELSHEHMEFTRSLFPQEDIYVCLLDGPARMAIGRIGEKTRPAQHLLESVGFSYIHEVDPFDGGPHYGAAMDEVSVVRHTQKATGFSVGKGPFNKRGYMGTHTEGGFRAAYGSFSVREDGQINIPENVARDLGLNENSEVWTTYS